jgi:hypothetical protein
MKNKFTYLFLVLLIVPANTFSQDYKIVQSGIEYAEVTREVDGIPVRMNLLRLDLKKVRLDVVHAYDKAIGLETTSAIAKRKDAIAAVNAGYFRIDESEWEGDAVSTLQIDGKLWSESSNNRAALFITNGKKKTDAAFGHLFLTMFMKTGPSKGKLGFLFNFSGIDREWKAPDELLLFTPEFGATTKTGADDLEIVVDRKGRVTQTIDGKGNTPIPANGSVISASGSKRGQLKFLKAGDKITIDKFSSTLNGEMRSPLANAQAEDIIAGNPQLIRKGRVDITWEFERSGKSHVETKHPRTAAALLKDGRFLLVTIDGRSESSGGVGLDHLAKLLLDFGAVDAMNLDGGGSTTMYLNGQVVNHPSDKSGERPVSDVIIVTARKGISGATVFLR